MKTCIGITKSKRWFCGKSTGGRFFCDQHRAQPFWWFVSAGLAVLFSFFASWVYGLTQDVELTPSDFRMRLAISAHATAYEYGYTPPEIIEVYGRAGSASFNAKLSLETPAAREYSRGRDPHRWWQYEDKAPIVTGLNSKCTLNSLVGETIKAHVPIRVFDRKNANLWQFQLYIYISGREFMESPNDDGDIEIKLTQDNLAI
jgi:hypothetical protein